MVSHDIMYGPCTLPLPASIADFSLIFLIVSFILVSVPYFGTLPLYFCNIDGPHCLPISSHSLIILSLSLLPVLLAVCLFYLINCPLFSAVRLRLRPIIFRPTSTISFAITARPSSTTLRFPCLATFCLFYPLPHYPALLIFRIKITYELGNHVLPSFFLLLLLLLCSE